MEFFSFFFGLQPPRHHGTGRPKNSLVSVAVSETTQLGEVATHLPAANKTFSQVFLFDFVFVFFQIRLFTWIPAETKTTNYLPWLQDSPPLTSEVFTCRQPPPSPHARKVFAQRVRLSSVMGLEIRRGWASPQRMGLATEDGPLHRRRASPLRVGHSREMTHHVLTGGGHNGGLGGEGQPCCTTRLFS